MKVYSRLKYTPNVLTGGYNLRRGCAATKKIVDYTFKRLERLLQVIPIFAKEYEIAHRCIVPLVGGDAVNEP